DDELAKSLRKRPGPLRAPAPSGATCTQHLNMPSRLRARTAFPWTGRFRDIAAGSTVCRAVSVQRDGTPGEVHSRSIHWYDEADAPAQSHPSRQCRGAIYLHAL